MKYENTKIKKHEIYLLLFSCFRPFVINLSVWVSDLLNPAYTGKRFKYGLFL